MKTQWTLDNMPRLDGKTFVVTGANSGIGYEAARAFARGGAHVVLACRSEEKTKDAMTRIWAESPSASLSFAALDLADLDSVRQCAKELLAKHPHIDVLVDNAGVMALPRRTTKQGFEMQFGTNHLGHFLFTGLLLGRVIGSAPSRVVVVSSGAHRMGKITFDDLQREKKYAKWSVYGQSKLANLLFTYELQRRLAAHHLDVRAVACHPGYAATNLQAVGPEMGGSKFMGWMLSIGNKLIAQDQVAGALPTVFAATAPEAEGGEFIGPGGFGGVRGAPVKHQSNKRSHDEEVAKKLWEVSEELVGFKYDFAVA